MNLRSIWHHPGLIVSSALSFSLMFGCSSTTVTDGGVADSGPIVDAGPDAGADAGPPCITVGHGGCFVDTDCCFGLTCDQNSNHCVVSDGGPGHDAGPTCSTSGEKCVTLADCCQGFGLACNTPGDAGGLVCGACGVNPTASCVTNGNACGGADGGACCSGNCVGGSCVAWTACQNAAGACASNTDCCAGFNCVGAAADGGGGGACTAVCGGTNTACTTDADCCTGQGEFCNTQCNGGGAATCFPINLHLYPGTCTIPFCGTAGAPACQIGAACDPTIGGTATDPCLGFGGICLTTPVNGLGYCAPPGPFQPCAVCGPACQPIPNSSATNMQCLPLNGGNICLQPCVSTSDCIFLDTSCQAEPTGGGKVCLGDTHQANPSNNCVTPFQPCNSAGMNDGLCQQVAITGGTVNVCVQAGVGDAGLQIGQDCSQGNRQQGDLCALYDICQFGLCAAACTPLPPAGDAGINTCLGTGGVDAGQYCFAPGTPMSGYELGSCSYTCDPRGLPGTDGCLVNAGDPAQICTPALVLPVAGRTIQEIDSLQAVCTLAPAGALVAIGADCASNSNCVNGGICITMTVSATMSKSTCFQICGDPDGGSVTGQVGAGGCATAEECFSIGINTGAAMPYQTKKIGFCDALCDGGPC